MKNLSTLTFLVFMGFSIILSAQTPNLLWAKQLGGTKALKEHLQIMDIPLLLIHPGIFTKLGTFKVQ